jgi:hypothetical protein
MPRSGDLSPKNIGQMIFIAICMMAGMTIVTSVLLAVTGLITI